MIDTRKKTMYYKNMIGDRCVPDLTPSGLNIGHRLIKNMRIAGSGIYQYHRSELDSFGLGDSIPEKYARRTIFNIYRPPEVLRDNAPMFARIPIITGEHQAVTLDNAKDLTVGLTGDTVEAEVDPQDGEVYLYTTGTIVAGDGLTAYRKDGQLSCGYVPTAKWEDGVHKGVEYQAVLTGFEDVNHILICHTARGGPQCMFMDSIKTEDKGMGLLDRFFGKREELKSNPNDLVSVLLQSIAVGADPKVQIPKIRKEKVALTGDSARIFKEYLTELEDAEGEEPDTIKRAANIVLDFYRNAVGDSCKDCKDLPGDEDEEDSKKKDEKPAGDEDDEDSKKKDEKPAGDEDDEDKDKKKDEKPTGDAIKSFIVDTINATLPGLVTEAVENAMKPYKTTGDSSALIDSNRPAKSETSSTLIQNWLGGSK